MKNLKKVLALVLVVASLMGMATMASATTSDDYSDADSITHVEAVDVMSTIGVFDGISGAFSGDSILTREQAAKIITYMILGKDDADALVASVAPYTDVSRDRWSAGSIAYCKNEGILAGVGNGRFEPDGKLTGVAFAKMCLVALGYDPEVEKLTGPDWAVNTSTIAIADADITGDLSQASLADEMSREDACQMAFNTLQADMVDYEDRGSVIVAGDVTISNKPSKAKPVATETKWANAADHNGIKKDKIQQFAEKYFNKLKKDDTEDSFGRPATTWKYKADEIGTYIDSSKLVQSWTAKAPRGEMYSAIGGSIVDKLKDGPDDDGNYTLQGWSNGYRSAYTVGKDVDVKTVVEDYFVKNSTKAAGKKITGNIGESGNGVLTELYMDDEDNVTVVMINTFLVKATADYNTVNERVNIEAVAFDDDNVSTTFLPTYIDNDDFDVTGVKEGDYLLVTASGIEFGSNKKATLESVTPATVQTGTVSEYTSKDDVTVGGTKYSYNKILGDNEKDEEFSINSDATLILDTYGYIMCVDEAVSSSSFVYINKFGPTSGLNTKAVADAYFTDGSSAEISVAKVDGKRGYSDIVANPTGWYTYSGSSGGQYTLTTPSSSRYEATETVTNTTGGVELIKGSTVRFMSRATSGVTGSTKTSQVKADDKTIFVIKDNDDDVTAYTGIANVPDVTLGASYSRTEATVAWICKDDNNDYASYVFVDVSDDADVDIDGGTSTADYMFVLKATNNKTHVDGETYFKYTVVIDGKEEERWISDELGTGTKGDNGRLFYNVREDSNGRITDAKEVGKEGTSSRRFRGLMETETVTGDANDYTYYANDSYSGGQDTITRKGNTLSIPALGDKSELIVNSKSNLNLVLGKDSDLLSDEGDDYECYLNTSVNNIGSTLDGYYLSGRVYLITDDDDSNVIDTLWIYVAETDEQ